jgi:hypothetical protein
LMTHCRLRMTSPPEGLKGYGFTNETNFCFDLLSCVVDCWKEKEPPALPNRAIQTHTIKTHVNLI